VPFTAATLDELNQNVREVVTMLWNGRAKLGAEFRRHANGQRLADYGQHSGFEPREVARILAQPGVGWSRDSGGSHKTLIRQ